MAVDAGMLDYGGGRAGMQRGRGGLRAPAPEIKELFDKLPPHSQEAEMSLLGSMILDPRVTSDVIAVVSSGEAFYSPAHGAIFDAIVRLYDTHQSGDLVQLADALKDRASLEDVGGAEYLLRLAEQVPTSVNAPHYARIVSEKHRLRRLIDAAGQILFEAYHAGQIGDESTSATLDRAEQRIFEIADKSESGDAQRLADLLQDVYDSLEDNRGSRLVTGVTTGYYDLDEMTSGLQQGELIIIAARPSMGKTALALNLAEQIAMGGPPGIRTGERQAVAVFSMEMSKQAVAQRFMCARSGVDSHMLRTNRLRDADFDLLGRALDELRDAPILVDDTPALSVLQLRARARRMKARHNIRAIFVDYLQLMTAPGSQESRQVEVSAISRGVKALARELSVPVICLSQLNRAAEQREGHRPRMSDLRESGSIEQDADVIMLLHREEYYHQGDPSWAQDPDNEEKVGLAELIIAKQRNGPTGVVQMQWDSGATRFRNRAERGGGSSAWSRAGAWQAPVVQTARRDAEPAPGARPAPKIGAPPPDAPYDESSDAPFEPGPAARGAGDANGAGRYGSGYDEGDEDLAPPDDLPI